MPTKNQRLLKLLDVADNKVEKILSSYEKEIVQHYKAFLREAKLKLANLHEKFADELTGKIDYKKVKLDSLIKGIRKDVRSLSKVARDTIEESIKDIFGSSYELTGAAINTALETEIGFSKLPTEKIKASVLNPADKIKWYTRNNKHLNKLTQDVKTEVTQGLIQGKGYPEIARGISKRTGAAAGKAVRIARTETHRVSSAGRQLSFDKTFEAAGELGIEVQRIWITVKDSRTRPDHLELNNTSPDEDGYYYFSDGVKTKAPGLSGDPNHDINCRCTEGIKVKGI